MPDDAPAAPTANPPFPLFTCPYCGGPTPDQPRCVACNGLLDPLSRQATQNAMGPWFVRDEHQPHRPGCSFETILTLIARGKITTDAILRGPTTAQFWYPAKRVPGVANRLGVCHACQAAVHEEASCPSCHASFEVEGDRQTLGLLPIRLIPGQGTDAPASAARSMPPAPALPVAAPRAAEARRAAAAAAAKRRSSALLGATVGFAIVGVMVLTLVLVTRDTPSGAAPRVSEGAEVAAPRADTSASRAEPDAAAAAPPTEATPPQAMSTPKPPESAPVVEPASPPARDPDLDTLRKTRLP